MSASGLSSLNSSRREHKLEAKLADGKFGEFEFDSAAQRKMKNRDAAIKSRQKKKSDTEQVQAKLDRTVKECTHLKLDNAALRAEN